MNEGIRTIDITKNDRGEYNSVRIVFGPHHFLSLTAKPSGKVEFALGATHHGFKADGSQVSGELEKIIDEIRAAHPKLAID